MKPRPNFHTFVIALCMAALFAVQAFGGQRAYLCMCAGKVVLTQTTHCHGPHGAQCHASGAIESHDEESQGNREEHAVVKTDMRFAKAAPQFAAAPSVLLAVLPLFEVLSAPPEVPLLERLRDEGLPPFGVTVARTVVLLI